jgi:hypothetical protein
VAAELLALCGVSPAAAAAAAAAPAGALAGGDLDAPFLRHLLAAEYSVGRYPATQALLRLLTTLVSGEVA